MTSQPRGRRVAVAAWAIVGLTAVLAVVFASRFGTDPGLSESPLIGQPAPSLVLPGLLDDTEVEIHEPGEIAVVNFFASWCLECRIEHDALVATADAFVDGDVRFIAVAYQDEPADSLRFLEEEGMSQATSYVSDPTSRAAIAFGVFGIPETYFINADGTVVGRIIGPTDALTLGSTIDAIKAGGTPGEQRLGNTRSSPADS